MRKWASKPFAIHHFPESYLPFRGLVTDGGGRRLLLNAELSGSSCRYILWATLVTCNPSSPMALLICVLRCLLTLPFGAWGQARWCIFIFGVIAAWRNAWHQWLVMSILAAWLGGLKSNCLLFRILTLFLAGSKRLNLWRGVVAGVQKLPSVSPKTSNRFWWHNSIRLESK